MPLGEIKPRRLSAKEKEWRDRWVRWEGRAYRDLLPTLRHMSRKEYFAWTYTVDPRVALILATEPKFRDVLAYQRSKRWYHEIIDWVWRAVYGNR